MTRIIIQKDGITTDIPENELTNFLRLGYEKIGTAPDAPLPQDLKPTKEEQAVTDALLDVVEAEKKLTEAENKNIKARSSVTAKESIAAEPIIIEEKPKKKVG